MTILGESELKKIANNQFALDFVRAKLTQQGSDQPKVYEGSGSISQDGHGSLQLKLYSRDDDVEGMVRQFGAEMNASNLPPGQVLGANHYYSFEGVDLYGQTWKASRVSIEVKTGISAGGHVILGKSVREIENRRPYAHAAQTRATLIVPGAFRIPFTHAQPGTSEPGLSTCTLALGGSLTATLKRYQADLVVVLALSDQDPVVYPQRVLEAVGIALGAHLRPQVELTVANDEQRQTIRSLDDEAKRGRRVMPPAPMDRPADFPDFQAFVVKFMVAFPEPNAQLVGYWFRVLSASGDSLENQALVMTTTVEGILKAYFASDTKPPAQYVNELMAAKPIIGKLLNIAENVRQRLTDSLSHGKNPTAANALRALEMQLLIPP